MADNDNTKRNEKEVQKAVIKVDVSSDKMEARVSFDTTNGTHALTEEEILEALKEKDISFGLDHEAIRAATKSLVPFIAARGERPVKGEDAYIERKFDLGVRGRPKIDQFDRADFKDLNLFTLTKAGDVLAERIPQTDGTPGRNVFGVEVAPRKGKPCPLPQGKNTETDGENTVRAAINGQIVDMGKKIEVDPCLVIKGSVGVSTGNIDFDGSVEIGGDVTRGFAVKATGDISIKGFIDAAEVSGRNVFVEGGISGGVGGSAMKKGLGKVTAKEDVRALFTTNGTVEAGRDIYIRDAILHSEIYAGGSLLCVEKRGMIIGGTVTASVLIRANSTGNAGSVRTTVAVGVDPLAERLRSELRAELKEMKRELQRLAQALKSLDHRQIASLPPDRAERFLKMTHEQYALAGDIKRKENMLSEAEDRIKRAGAGRILVLDRVYAGTCFSIRSLRYTAERQMPATLVTIKDNVLDVSPYVKA
ncbi:FapA family protein [Mitsuokella sp. oral taxon 131]|uniref:FapA family protein n=1 Tax=Mitsuokella sp. oral taxon 131 TaxID=1321780 RepID=UPI0003ADF122|nr:FapA family protein [Mitsuokella sp. oral taxon 131]ERL03630.1 hypothetical protein HMPREF1985_02073 [Mitsuokella sp. oral taxon 131 str. W9106]